MTAATAPADPEPTLADKVGFLSRPQAYGLTDAPIERRETHMSWVFFAGDRVYKLKKPVRLPYLDFSSLERRRHACAAELRLNRRLAADVYLDVVPLTLHLGALQLAGLGRIVDWLVVMRRLDESRMLEHRLADHIQDRELDELAALLVRFYRHAMRVHVAPARHLADWRAAVAYNRKILLEPRLGLPAGLVRRIDGVQRRFLRRHGDRLAERARDGRILDAHGDLRPEHIWLSDGLRIIDCLEFSAPLRANDPLDEIAFLDLECEQLGAPEAGRRIRERVLRGLDETADGPLYRFYRCYRAALRARLSIAHLLEPDPRTPEKWPRRARQYLAIALGDALELERRL
jgi:aminoglycoside phosphotransferase family enzyme